MMSTPGSASTSSGKVGPHMLSPRRGRDQDWKIERLAAFARGDDVVLQLSRRVVAHACHQADLVVDRMSAAFSEVSGS